MEEEGRGWQIIGGEDGGGIRRLVRSNEWQNCVGGGARPEEVWPGEAPGARFGVDPKCHQRLRRSCTRIQSQNLQAVC